MYLDELIEMLEGFAAEAEERGEGVPQPIEVAVHTQRNYPLLGHVANVRMLGGKLVLAIDATDGYGDKAAWDEGSEEDDAAYREERLYGCAEDLLDATDGKPTDEDIAVEANASGFPVQEMKDAVACLVSDAYAAGKEQVEEAGMLGGVDAANDAAGQSLEVPE